MSNINYADLTQTQIEFINNYIPKTTGFTSAEEMKEIISIFNLSNISDAEDMRAIRNSVVKTCSPLIKENWEKMQTMQSIVAVIDHCMYKLNPSSVM